MMRRMWIFVSIFFFIGYLISWRISIKSNRTSNDLSRQRSFRAAIVTLTRGDSSRLLNMLHSIEYFHPSSMHQYPVIIFYDPSEINLKNFQINRIQSCVKLHLIFEKIVLFELLQTSIEYIKQEKSSRSIRYRLMCQFWSHTVFHHPSIHNHYDYILRLDDDSVFLEKFNFDLFQYADENQFDYLYRALAWDIPMAGPNYLLPNYLETYHNQCQSSCFPFYSYHAIYNNFFLARVQFWYNERVERFLQLLLINDTIIRYSLGDGNIHAVILTLASNTQRSKRIDFAYAHNIHIYGKHNKNFDLQHNYHHWFEILANHSENTCRQLIIITPYTKQLVYISLH